MEDFERMLDRAYRRFAPLAKRYYYTFTRPSVTVGGKPAVLFLGNHSSGKSSLINWLLGDPPVQDTGVAPTDDGFTFIMHGDRDEDVFGPAAAALLPEEFRALESFGPAFLQHLVVKRRCREALRRVHLIDSPGMIDSAEGTATRDYDFAGVVKRFAELCDMVFFLFDPDKPGTTGETVNVFAKCLRGLEFKLRVLLNKCDTFASLYDFARAYGTLCWNLSRVLRTKDLPKIFTVYSGAARRPAGPGLDLDDFNRHRSEFLSIFDAPAARRADSVFAAAYADFAGLSIRMRVVDLALARLRAGSARTLAAGGLSAIAAAAAALIGVGRSFAADLGSLSAASVAAWAAAAAAAAIAVCIAAPLCRRSLRRRRAALAERADALFEECYPRETAIGVPDELRQRWAYLKDETQDVIARAPMSRPFLSAMRRAAVDAVAAKILDSMPRSNTNTGKT